ncbi:iron-sulfur cluster repair di-iron protein [Bacillus sp. V33-4]|uniref:iron-sulfur cluster repair di-iron protein n=1 Tax=Bacillus sp. V33-4 TaxID=2054169 RepID=UPI000C78280C|nr:iron-sulfur cluster repair di-iron protein [Bacillus sp. V33-4]PLR83334.1 iron-sulfur cluster repair di-iron protein [Bacillus sp. V33-4]
MSLPFSATSLVKDIVNELPKSSDIFKRHRIDFCCGGNIPLNDAAAQRNVDVDSLMEELNEVYQKSGNEPADIKTWMATGSAELIEQIKEKFHRPLEEELSQLSPYVTKVSRVHGDRRPELLKVYELYYELKKELLEHTAKEEESIFPLLLKLETAPEAERTRILEEIRQLEKEHDHAGAILKELRDITSDFTPPLDACGTYRLVYKRLEMLEEQTFMHVHLENNILFPRYLTAN